MSENDSSQQVNWGLFFKTFVWFLALGFFLGIGFDDSLIFFSILITGIFVAYFFAVNPSGDNSKGETVKVEESVSKNEDQKIKKGSKTVTKSDENEFVGKVIKYYGLAEKEGGVSRLKVDEPIVVGDIIKFNRSQASFIQEIKEIRAEGTNTKEVALEGEVSIRVDSRVEVGAEVFLISKDDRPADVKGRILEERKKREDSGKSVKNDENQNKVKTKSNQPKEEEKPARGKVIGKVENYYGLAAKDGGIARIEIDEGLAVGDKVRFEHDDQDYSNYVQKIEEIRVKHNTTSEFVPEGSYSIRVDKKIKIGSKIRMIEKDERHEALEGSKEQEAKTEEIEEKKSKKISTEKGRREKEPEDESKSQKKDQKKKGSTIDASHGKGVSEIEGSGDRNTDGVVKNYWYLASRKKYLAKIDLKKNLKAGYKIKFFGVNTNFAQEVGRVKVGDEWVKSAATGETVEIVAEGKIQKGDTFTIVQQEQPDGNKDFEKKDLEVPGQELGKITNYWNLANDEGGLAKVNICKKIKSGEVVHFWGENTDFSQTIEIIKHHGKEVSQASEGKSFEVKVKNRVRVGDLILSTSSRTRENQKETQEKEAEKDRKKQKKDDESPEERRRRVNSLLKNNEKDDGSEEQKTLEKDAKQGSGSTASSKQDVGDSLNDEKASENASDREDGIEENSTSEGETKERLESPFLNRRPVKRENLEKLRESLLREFIVQGDRAEESPGSTVEQNPGGKNEEDIKKEARLSTQASAKYFNESIEKLRSQLLNSLIKLDSLDPEEEKRRDVEERRSRERIDFPINGNGSKESRGFWSRWSNRVEKLEPNSFREEASSPDDVAKYLAGQNDGGNSTVQNYFNSIDPKLFTKSEENRVAHKVKEGNKEARKSFIEHNLRLPISIAKRYRWSSLSFEDLIQAGNEGLIKAVDRFAPNKGNRFSTYATYWVKQTIVKAIKNDRLIKLPSHIQETQSKIEKIKQELHPSEELGRNRIADKLDITSENVKRAIKHNKPIISLGSYLQFNAPDELGIKMDRRRLVKANPYKETSKLKPSYQARRESGKGNKMEVPLVELIEDLEARIGRKEMWKAYKEKLKNGLKGKLSSRKYQILLLRYGFQSEEKTLKEVGRVFDVSRERIRQLQKQAIDDLRDVKLVKELNKYKLDCNHHEPVDRYALAEPWPDQFK